MIRPTTAYDILDLAPRLREADKREAEVLANLGPLEALSMGLMHSHSCMTGVGKDGSVVCVFGVVPVGNGAASVWLMCSPEVAHNKREIITTGRRWLDEQQAEFHTLANIVTAENDVHIRLIRGLGFTLGEPFTIPNTTQRAIPFERRL